MNKFIFFILCGLLLRFCPSISAQSINWKVGFDSYFDNREYYNNYAYPGSILGSKVHAFGGFSIDENNSFNLGGDWLYEFGDELRPELFNPILFFEHHANEISLYMGAFPRNGLIAHNNILLSDTFNYFRPNVEGIYLEYANSWFKQNVWLDWTSRQTTEAHEAFLVGGTGTIGKGIFMGRYDFIMCHVAAKAEQTTPNHVRDNGGLTFVAGLNLSDKLFVDSMSVSTGIAYSYDRLRGIYELEYYYGSLTELFVNYKRGSLRNTLYVGDGQVNLVGDKLYTAKFYNRIDFILDVFKKGRVKGEVECSLHFLPEVMDFSQKFHISVNLGRTTPLNNPKWVDW